RRRPPIKRRTTPNTGLEPTRPLDYLGICPLQHDDWPDHLHHNRHRPHPTALDCTTRALPADLCSGLRTPKNPAATLDDAIVPHHTRRTRHSPHLQNFRTALGAGHLSLRRFFHHFDGFPRNAGRRSTPYLSPHRIL